MSTSMLLFVAVVAATALERLLELVLAARHARWSFDRGGVESGRRHFAAMVGLHSALLIGAVVEVWAVDRPFIPAVGWVAFAAVVASQALRWWCIAALGRRWNTRIIVVPSLPLIRRGPYRWLRHPNYVAVVVEGLALPLVHTAWITAAAFTVINAMLLFGLRIPAEERALARVDSPAGAPPHEPEES